MANPQLKIIAIRSVLALPGLLHRKYKALSNYSRKRADKNNTMKDMIFDIWRHKLSKKRSASQQMKNRSKILFSW